jgi:hypothetical protein
LEIQHTCSVVWFPVARGKAREKSNTVVSIPAGITAWDEVFLAAEILVSAFKTLWQAMQPHPGTTL